MAAPTLYYGNLLLSGTLSGSESTAANPVRRLADGSITLPYTLTTSGVPSGQVQVTLVGAQAPDALVLALGSAVSGMRWTLESEDVGGGNNATVLDFTLSGATDRFVRSTSGATAREVWRLTVSGGGQNLEVRELQLAFKLALPRPQVGVDRTLVRQFSRIEIPGGQPFVKREGPRLRRTRYSFILLSGTQVAGSTSVTALVSGFESAVRAVEGGQAFTLVDDRGIQYWAELLEKDQLLPDEAGVFSASVLVQEIAID